MSSDQHGDSGRRRRVLVCSAPGRAGIIGNPTDMYGGAVLSCSVALRARVTVVPSARLVLETNGEELEIAGRDDLRPRRDHFDVARAVLDYLHLPVTPPCHVRYESEIPLHSGLAGSTALVVALLQALLAWQGKNDPPYRLAERARYVELNYLKVVCGYQDAYMCTFGGLNYMDFGGKQFYRKAEAELYATVEPLAFHLPPSGPGAEPSPPFVLGFTGVQHASGAVHKPIRERWLEGEAVVVDGYRRITEIARLGKKALLTADWPLLGHLMNENHAIQRELGGSGESNETLIEAALEAGALGAKLAGAGHGGTIIALWPWPDATPLENALRDVGASAIYRPELDRGVTIESDDREEMNKKK